MSNNEHEEAFAQRLIANGNGSHRLQEHSEFDEAACCFWLEEPDAVAVYLRRDGKTKREFHFRIVPASLATEAPEQKDEVARDVRLAVAKRFLLDAADVARELSPGALRQEILEKTLDHLVESGQLRDGEGTEMLRAFIRAWTDRKMRKK